MATQRGRKSITQIMLETGPNSPEANYPDAPYNLTDAETDEWRAIVSSMKPGYFARSHYPMLSQLCRHIVASNRVAQLIEDCCKKKKGKSTFNEERFSALLSLQATESTAIVRLCRQMRLSHQAIVRAEGVNQRPLKHPALDAPWNNRDEEKDD